MDPKNINNALNRLHRKVNDLPENAELWPEQPEHWRAGLMIEWDILMSQLAQLHEGYQNGEMAAHEAQRYRDAAKQLLAYLPIVRQLGWALPSVSLDEDIAA